MPHTDDDENEIDFPTDETVSEPDEGAPARILHDQPSKRSKKKPAPSAGLGHPHRVAVGEDPHARCEWEFKEADFLWPEMLQELARRTAKGHPRCLPQDITIRVIAMSVNQQTLPGEINGAAVTGDTVGGETRGPGEALCTMIDDFFHLPRCNVPATYDLVFTWKSDGRMFGRGRLNRPGAEEIIAMRRNRQQHAQRRPPPNTWEAYGVGAPPSEPQHQPSPSRGGPPPQYPPQYPAQYQGYAPPPGHYGYPPQAYQQQQPTGPTYAEAELRAQLAHLTGQFQEVVSFVKQQGMPLPAGLAAPPPPVPPPTPVYAPAPAPLGDFDALTNAMTGLARLRNMKDQLDSFFDNGSTGLGAPDDDAPSPPIVGPIEVAKPDDGLPFHVIKIPETTLNYAKNKETGDIDIGGTVMSNMESEVVRKVVGLASDFAQGLIKAAGVRANGHILPPGPALNGLPAGVGAPVQVPNGTGEGAGGWRPS